jgi:hypothetical protein
MRARQRAVGRGATTLLWAGLATACGDPAGGGAAGYVMTDSAGVAIAENGGPAWRVGAGWRVDPVPVLSIGEAEGPAERVLHGVRSVRFASRSDELPGYLVAQATELRTYDAGGGLVGTYGRAGEGPGEFARIGAAVPCPGGGAAVVDLLRPRLTVFEDGVVRTLPMPAWAAGGLNDVVPAHCAGGVVLGRTTVSGGGSGIRRDRLVAVRIDLAAGAMDTILSVAGGEVFEGLLVPFGRMGLLAFTATQIHSADTGRPEIRVHDLDGRLVRVIRLAPPERRVTDADRVRIRAQYLAGVPQGAREEIEPRLDAVTIPDVMPYFSGLHAGADGTLWVRPYQAFRDETVSEWWAVSAAGRWLGAVELPAGFDPHEFTADAVVGVHRDELGIERVRVHALDRGTG